MKLNNFGKRYKTFFQAAQKLNKDEIQESTEKESIKNEQFNRKQSKKKESRKTKKKEKKRTVWKKTSCEGNESENKIILIVIVDMMQIQKQLTKIVLDVVDSDSESKVSVKFKILKKMIRSLTF